MSVFGARTARPCLPALVSAETSIATGQINGPSLAEHQQILALRITKVWFPLHIRPGMRAIAVFPFLIVKNYKLLGQAAGDATENLVLRNYLNTLSAGKGLQLFIDVHSYSQLFMTRKFIYLSCAMVYVPTDL
jgi:hypothetical protein